jgi:hypothetical protein
VTRRLRLGLIFLIAALFLVVSGLLARAFSIDGAERAAITALLQAEARGDATAMTARIARCASSPACRARVALDTRYLKRPGKVLILELNSSAGFSLGPTTGTARVAWRAGSALPIVQCVRVHRAGNVISGLRIQLLEISARIKTSGTCPARY